VSRDPNEENIMTALLIIGGLILLVVGGEMLVRGAVKIASSLGMSPLLIGLTLVGFGTSMPELVTSVQASMAGSPGIAVGNIVGSNIANVLLILGVSAMIFPISVKEHSLWRDGLVMLATAVTLLVIGYVWNLGRLSGGLFVAALAAYVWHAYLNERTEQRIEDVSTAPVAKAGAFNATHPGVAAGSRLGGPLAGSIVMLVAGLALVILGGKLLVDGAIDLARAIGLSETVIGLTIVAVGTSMPEMVTSVIAALRKQSDVALGNVLGSNIYNILGIGGVTGLIAPTAIPDAIVSFDNWIMVAVSALVIVLARTGLNLDRREGALLVAGYAVYVYLIWP
jgi:cation:H+ antiporter